MVEELVEAAVAIGEDVEEVVDNPGLWTDHCHTLAHPAEGLVAHLAYEGVSTPYRVGDVGGHTHSDPE